MFFIIDFLIFRSSFNTTILPAVNSSYVPIMTKITATKNKGIAARGVSTDKAIPYPIPNERTPMMALIHFVFGSFSPTCPPLIAQLV